jgi:hypothetical protein
MVFILIPALILSQIEEGWSYLDAVYYCIISITTVGLGDYVPGAVGLMVIGADIYRYILVAYLYVGVMFCRMWVAKIRLIFRLQFNQYYEPEESGNKDSWPWSVEAYNDWVRDKERDMDQDSNLESPSPDFDGHNFNNNVRQSEAPLEKPSARDEAILIGVTSNSRLLIEGPPTYGTHQLFPISTQTETVSIP